MWRASWILTCISLLLWSPKAVAQPDSVWSFHIADADGTTGQDTTAGQGVKTPHIQDGAVTSDKLGDEAVTESKLGTGAVTETKLGAGSVTESKLGTEAVTEGKLGPEAVTESKLGTGAVTESKLGTEAVTESKLGTGAVRPWHIGMYGRTAFVAPSGGDYTDPATAMNDYATWCGTPSETSPCLLKIMPGVYDIGDTYMAMRSYIDIEGSGIETTMVRSSASYAVYGSQVAHAELRSLTVENTHTGSLCQGIYLSSSSSRLTDLAVSIPAGICPAALGINLLAGAARIDRVEIRVAVSALTTDPYRFAIGLGASQATGEWSRLSVSVSAIQCVGFGVQLRSNSAPTIRSSRFDVTADLNSRGVIVYDSDIDIENSSVRATGGDPRGVRMNNATATIFRSRVVTSDGNSAYASGGSEVRVDSSVLEGGPVYTSSDSTMYVGSSRMASGSSGNVACAFVYDGDYTSYANSCP